MTDQIQVLQSVMERKEKENNDLVNKLNETIKDYETKLAQKDEQIVLLNDKLNEEAARRNQMNADAHAAGDLEKKWQSTS